MADDTDKKPTETSDDDGKKTEQGGGQSGEQSGDNADPAKPKPQFTTEQQTYIDNLISERLERDRRARQVEAETEAERLRVESQRAAGQHEQLARDFEAKFNAEKARADQLDQQLTATRATIKSLLEAEIKTLPDEVKTMLPALTDDEGTIKIIVEKLPQARELAKKMTAERAPGFSSEDEPPPPGGGGEKKPDPDQKPSKRLYRTF
jgi:hypothetical protein